MVTRTQNKFVQIIDRLAQRLINRTIHCIEAVCVIIALHNVMECLQGAAGF